jgi:hypothetical protein
MTRQRIVRWRGIRVRLIVHEIHVTKTHEGVVGIIYANRIKQYKG